jgi:hypothetical protein
MIAARVMPPSCHEEMILDSNRVRRLLDRDPLAALGAIEISVVYGVVGFKSACFQVDLPVVMWIALSAPSRNSNNKPANVASSIHKCG